MSPQTYQWWFPGPAWPASYTTGPLGANNILPSSNTGSLLILWPQVSGSNRTALTQRVADCGRAFDGIGIHYGGISSEIPGAGGSQLGSGAEQWVHDQGSIPIVSWMPGRALSTSITQNTMISVNNGDFDTEFNSALNYWKALGFRVMWRLAWEFDGNWFPWSPTSNSPANDGQNNPGCTAAQWKTAWQRIVGLRNTAAANNVGFWWCPTEGNDRTLATSCYPGDAYVDWVGSDGYNQASASVQTSPLHAGWAEFWELFNYTGHGTSAVCKHDEFGPSKPFIVGETGSLYDSGDVNRKANWYRNIDSHANGKSDMPNLCGIQFFDADVHTSEGFDWRVDVSQTYAQKQTFTQGSIDSVTYQGFKDFAAISRWNVGAAGGAT